MQNLNYVMNNPCLAQALNSLSSGGKEHITPFGPNSFINKQRHRIQRFSNGWINSATRETFMPFGNGSISSTGKRVSIFGSGLITNDSRRVANPFGTGILSSNGKQWHSFGNGILTQGSIL